MRPSTKTHPRVLVLTDRYPPYYEGGYEIACHAVMERLREQGMPVCVVTSTFGVGRERVDGHVHRVLHRAQDTSSMLTLGLWEVRDLRRLRRIIARFQPDVIYAWSMAQLFPSLQRVLRASGRPVVFAIHDVWIPGAIERDAQRCALWRQRGSSVHRRLGKTLMQFILKYLEPSWSQPVSVSDLPIDSVVFCSDYQRIRHEGAGLPVRDWRVIFNGVDLDRFTAKKHPTVRARDLRLLFVGRLVREKGAHIAIQTMAKLKRQGHTHVTLDIAGMRVYPMEYFEEMQEMVRVSGLAGQVRFLGAVPNKQLPDVYADHDVLLFPSEHLEGLPVTIIEAMACGVAVVASSAGGNADFLRDGLNSLTFDPPGDPAHLADLVERLIDDDKLRESLASEGRIWVLENCALDGIAQTTRDYLSGVASERTAFY